MATIRWSIKLHTICQRLSSTRKQIGTIVDSIQLIDPSDLDLDEELEPYRIDIAWWENEETVKAVSNAIVALAWASIEIALVETCKEVALRNKLKLPHRVPDRQRLKFLISFLKKNVSEVPAELYNHLSEIETVRNCVVHAYGLIHFYRDSSKLKNLVKNRKWLRISDHVNIKEDEAVVVEKEFVSTLLLDIEKWLEKSLTAIGIGPWNPIME